MGFLHKLWDETLAGPTPDTGLGKLRKYNSLSAVRSPPPTPPADQIPVSITRSITILRTNSTGFRNSFSSDPSSVPESPSGSITPRTPLTPGTPSGDFKKFTRRKLSADEMEHTEPTSPTVHHWIVLSALDR
ncbi:putative Dormancy/auxin associated family protein [Quillaja saponaria]|uniref:Dormancy/auxin associated family protein n=1 Tax=Quillaja saponaria TaxID=32244 RepID=A0AAD7L508_QUISA|nr:putative Dormancy/auxin associated family protein [Quillaja saponaria]